MSSGDVVAGMSRWAIERCDVLLEPWPLPDASVQTIVTSPPYLGLRDYRTDRQLGTERTVEEYVEKMVTAFREARRVLRADGTLWLNLGDCYANDGGVGAGGNLGRVNRAFQQRNHRLGILPGLKSKDMAGAPWEVALALRRDGWYLRRDIIWHKRNPMPESVKDRPTAAHEYIFLLSKSELYYYDHVAVRQPYSEDSHPRGHGVNPKARLEGRAVAGKQRADFPAAISKQFRTNREVPHPRGRKQAPQPGQDQAFHPAGRNLRDVWSLTSEPYSGPHFAPFPTEVPRRCILAATSEVGCCPRCAAPYERLERKDAQAERQDYDPVTIGWSGCFQHGGPPAGCVVLDPFLGSGTTVMVALRLGRRAIGFDISADYLEQARRRVVGDAPLFNR